MVGSWIAEEHDVFQKEEDRHHKLNFSGQFIDCALVIQQFAMENARFDRKCIFADEKG